MSYIPKSIAKIPPPVIVVWGKLEIFPQQYIKRIIGLWLLAVLYTWSG